MLSEEKENKIYNALLIGMSLADAYVYAGLSPQEITIVSEDPEYQLKYARLNKEFEYRLLTDLHEVARKQVKMGKEAALTWMLEKMFPRYSSKPQNENPTVNIHFDNVDPAALDTVAIHSGSANNGN